MKSIFFVIGICASILAHAEGNEGGHGGIGIKIRNHVEVLDLIERGMGEGENSGTADPYCLSVSRETLPREIQDTTIAALCSRLGEIKERDALTSMTLLRTMTMHRWSVVNQELNSISEATPLIKVRKKDLVQIAVRTASGIVISKPAWDQMSDFQRSALLIHEVVYSLIPWPNGKARSLRSREITAYLMQSRAKDRWQTWAEALSSDLPVIENLIHEQIEKQNENLLLTGAGAQIRLNDASVYNEAYWIEQISGKKFIGFAPVLDIRYAIDNPIKSEIANSGILTPTLTSPGVEIFERYPLPSNTLEANPIIFTRDICKEVRAGSGISAVVINYYTYAVFLEKRVLTQTVEWKLAPEREPYFAQSSEANTPEECEGNLPKRLLKDVAVRGQMAQPPKN